MAFISTEQVAEIRAQLKSEFKDFRFSVRREGYSKLCVAIMSAPIRFTESNYKQISTHLIDRYENSEILKRIVEICNKENYDNSDLLTDYFEVGFYFELSVGRWDKDFQLKN